MVREGAKNSNWKGGMSFHPLFWAWWDMKKRCSNPSHPAFRDYGGRGIQVCDRWLDFWQFIEDVGERPSGCVMDRIDNDGNYEPSNVRWATLAESARNRRTSGAEKRVRDSLGRFV